MKNAKLLFLISLLSFGLCGCDTTNPNTNKSDSEIMRVYRAYQENGGTLSYDEWLASIKGEKGDKGDKGDKGNDGVNGQNGLTPRIVDGYWWIGETNTNVKAVGIDGVNGENGKNGVDGSSLLLGASNPSVMEGKNGDVFLNTTSYDLFSKKDNAWSLIGNIKGTNGNDGNDGVSVSNAEIDSNGDLIISLSNGNQYNAGNIVNKKTFNVKFYIGDQLIEERNVLENSKIVKPSDELIGDNVVINWYLEGYEDRPWAFDGYFADRVNGDLVLHAKLGHDYHFNLTGNSGEKYIHIDIGQSCSAYLSADGDYDIFKANKLTYYSSDPNIVYVSVVDYGEIRLYAKKEGDCKIIVDDPDNLQHDELDFSVHSKTIDFTDVSFSYKVNCEQVNISDEAITAYRTGYDVTNDCTIIYPSALLTGPQDNSLCGMVENASSSNEFTYARLIYKGSGTFKFGPTKNCEYSVELPYGEDFTEFSISPKTNSDFEGSNYWRVETDQQPLYLKTLNLNYGGVAVDPGISYETTSDYRIHLPKYQGEKIPGVTKVSVPDKITQNGEFYTVTNYKEYTYYTFNYVLTNSIPSSEVALIDPVDIANYVMIYNEVPANFIAKNTVSSEFGAIGSYSEVSNYFGSDARYVSQYNRTDGYVNSVPYNPYGIKYLELDFASNDNYSLNSRDTSRIVYFANGFTCYDNAPVCLFTDDHYVTFKEYLNYGSFGTSFDVNQKGTFYRTGYLFDFNGSTTLTKAI